MFNGRSNFTVIERLSPGEMSPIVLWLECNRQSETGDREVSNHDFGEGVNLKKTVLIRVIDSIRAVHDELPVSTRLKLEELE